MLEGEHVVLAPLRTEDAPALFAWINDRDLAVLNARYRPVHEPDHVAWFEDVRSRGDVVIFGIRRHADDRLIGSCQLLAIDPVHRTAELQIRIADVGDRGQGHGTEAVRLLLRHAFADLDLRRVQLSVFADNAPAIRCYEKAGFLREGLLRQAVHVDGSARDVVVMGVLNGEETRAAP